MIVDDQNKDKEAITTPLLDAVTISVYQAEDWVDSQNRASFSHFKLGLLLREPIIFQLVSRFLDVADIGTFVQLYPDRERNRLLSDFKQYPGLKHERMPNWIARLKRNHYRGCQRKKDFLYRGLSKGWVCVMLTLVTGSLLYAGNVVMPFFKAAGILALITGGPFFMGVLLFKCVDTRTQRNLARFNQAVDDDPCLFIGSAQANRDNLLLA